MFKRIGRKFIQGAKEEIEENPEIFNPQELLKLAEAGMCLVFLGLLMFSSSRCSQTAKKSSMTIMTINNYYYKK